MSTYLYVRIPVYLYIYISIYHVCCIMCADLYYHIHAQITLRLAHHSIFTMYVMVFTWGPFVAWLSQHGCTHGVVPVGFCYFGGGSLVGCCL